MHLPSFMLFLAAAATGVTVGSAQKAQPLLFAATQNTDPAKGIYTYKLNTNDGSLTQWVVTPLSFATGELTTYLKEATSKKYDGKPLIHALNRATGIGYVSAMTLNANGKLDLLNTQQMLGGSPAHITLSPNEDFVTVANYAGSLSLVPLYENGSVAPETYYEAFPNGSRIVMDQQATGHIHSTRWLPNSNNVIAFDLGGDTLLQYELDTTKQTLKKLETVNRPPGSGPRHSVLSTSRDFLYVTDELSNTVGVYRISHPKSLLESPAIQNITSLPKDFTSTSTAADIHLSKNGKFVYVSNRGHNSIAIYAINESDGTLTSLGWESTRGLDEQTGLLAYTGNSYEIDGAVCLYVSTYLF
ncbi:hypothetical protein PInf_025787 [Phytophthora infestans]|nr:hypothetical protein PInf_025787 [Phytophthora infestans]